jgi:hypothetical protein
VYGWRDRNVNEFEWAMINAKEKSAWHTWDCKLHRWRVETRFTSIKIVEQMPGGGHVSLEFQALQATHLHHHKTTTFLTSKLLQSASCYWLFGRDGQGWEPDCHKQCLCPLLSKMNREWRVWYEHHENEWIKGWRLQLKAYTTYTTGTNCENDYTFIVL